MKVAAIIVAGGMGKRMGAEVSKQFLKLGKHPILFYTIERFDKNKNIGEIIVVIRKEDKDLYEREVSSKYIFDKDIKIAYGGSERYESVQNGLGLISQDVEVVMVHDGVRPFVTDEIIDLNKAVCESKNACITAVPSKDTVKIVSDDNYVESTPNRKTVYLAQTPQTFRTHIIREAYNIDFSSLENITDDSMLVEHLGYKISVVEGSYENIKVTTPEDLFTGELILRRRKKSEDRNRI